MDAFTPYLAALRRQDLLDEAENRRLVDLARASRSGVPAWRRGLGGLLASAATSVDPGVAVTTPRREATKGKGARAMAA